MSIKCMQDRDGSFVSNLPRENYFKLFVGQLLFLILCNAPAVIIQKMCNAHTLNLFYVFISFI